MLPWGERKRGRLCRGVFAVALPVFEVGLGKFFFRLRGWVTPFYEVTEGKADPGDEGERLPRL